ncbi:MAG TPA: HAD family hydrolase [Myxococcota bacterium]|nr:HAD family hydrolase [Myxococcota bacterium]
MPPAIRALSFDLFDTLVDLTLEALPPVKIDGELVSPTAPALYALLGEGRGIPFEVFARTLRGVDRDIRRNQYEAGREVSTRARFTALARALGIEDAALVERWRAEHMARLAAQVRTVDGHAELLGSLRTRVRLGLCSNFTDTETALGVLDHAALRGALDAVAISEAVGWRKPRREIFSAVARDLDTDPREVLHVGDNLDADVAGAAAAGMRTAWLTRRVADPSAAFLRYRGPRPEFTIASLAELERLLG